MSEAPDNQIESNGKREHPKTTHRAAWLIAILLIGVSVFFVSQGDTNPDPYVASGPFIASAFLLMFSGFAAAWAIVAYGAVAVGMLRK